MPDTTITINQSPSEVDWAVIANKALDMGTDVAKTMADKVKEVAPEAWEILIRQAYVDAIEAPLVCLFLSLIFAGTYYVLKKYWCGPFEKRGCYKSDEEIANLVFAKWIPALGIISCGITFAIVLPILIKVIINPKYYAIQKLFELAGMK